MKTASEPSSEFVDRPWMEGATAPAPEPTIPKVKAQAKQAAEAAWRACDTDRNWRVACHLAPAVLWLGAPYLMAMLVPLLIWQMKARPERDQALASCAVEALNFQISLFLVSVLLSITVIGLIFVPPLMLVGFILSIVASIKTYKGEEYRYSHSHRFIRDDLV